MFRPNTGHLQVSSWKAVRKICYTIMQTLTSALLHNCITNLTNSFSRWNLKMASVRPKHVFSNVFISWFLIITSNRKLLVVLLTVSPYQHSSTERSLSYGSQDRISEFWRYQYSRIRSASHLTSTRGGADGWVAALPAIPVGAIGILH